MGTGMTKRRRTRRKGVDKSKLLLVIAYVVIVILSFIAVGGLGYFFGYNNGKQDVVDWYMEAEIARKKAAEAVKKKEGPELKEQLKEVIEEESTKTAAHEYSSTDDVSVKPPSGPVRPDVLTVDLPKVAIIIDDVAFPNDVRKVKSLDMPVTMSFLPPSANHPESAALASKQPYYMVHLPLEAKGFSRAEPSTLLTDSSQQQIQDRITQIKELFPKVEYVNNHTGSTFTSNEIAMNRLIYALGKESIGFIDSRTTGRTVVPFVMKNFGLSYVARDIFLDDIADIDVIKGQIKQAVNVARKHGSAIVIGHPRRETMQALKESRGLLSKVDLVRIDELLLSPDSGTALSLY